MSCKCNFHGFCIGIDDEQLRKLARQKSWKCNGCTATPNIDCAGATNDMKAVWIAIADINKQLTAMAKKNSGRGKISAVPFRRPRHDTIELAGVSNLRDKIISSKRVAHENKDPVILVNFVDAPSTHEFVREAKRKRISTQSFGYEGDPKPMYVDAQLTRASFLLFKYTKRLKKIGFAYVWISSGDIMLRENSNSRFIKIKTRSQVDEIEKEYLLRKKGKNKTPRTEPQQNSQQQQPTTSTATAASAASASATTSTPITETNPLKRQTAAAHRNNDSVHVILSESESDSEFKDVNSTA